MNFKNKILNVKYLLQQKVTLIGQQKLYLVETEYESHLIKGWLAIFNLL